MLEQFTNTQILAATAVFTIVAITTVALYLTYRRTRARGLRTSFGPEYDRAIVTHGTLRKAEGKLADRATHVNVPQLRELAAAERERFVTEWQAVQARFVDHPKFAVTQADALISSLLVARGYPKGNFEQRAAGISVSYPWLMQDYRRANAIAVRPGRVDASTEELRKAMIQYRTIFDELVQAQES